MKKIKELRLSHNMTQQDLASILHVSHTTVSMWEKGASEASLSTLVQISDYFHVSIDYLIGHSDNQNLSSTATASPTVMSEDKQEVLKLYSALSDRNQGAWVERGRLILEEQNKKEAQYKKENASKVVSR